MVVVLLLVFAPNMPMGVGGGAQGDMHSSHVMRQRKEALRGLLSSSSYSAHTCGVQGKVRWSGSGMEQCCEKWDE